MTKFYSKITNAFYDDGIHSPAQMPADAKLITDQVWSDVLAAQATGDVIQSDANGLPIAVAPPAPTVAQVQASALLQIDAEAEVLRSQFITANSGQVATYILKYNQAIAYQAANYTGDVPGLVQSEVVATSTTAQASCEAIITQYNTWANLAAAIETTRRSAKVAVNAATNVGQITTAVTQATVGYSAIQAAAVSSGESQGT